MKRRTVLAGAASFTAAAMTGVSAAAEPATAANSKATEPRNISYHRWSGATDFATGAFAGSTVSGDSLTLSQPIGTLSYTDPYGSGQAVSYEYATWTSPTFTPGFGLTELVSSWNASTPGGTWLEVDMRGDTGAGLTKWYVMGRWAADDTQIHRTSVGGQADTSGTVNVDTFTAVSGVTLGSWQLRVQLYRPAGTTQTPSLRSIGAMASALPAPTNKLPTSPLGGAEGITLNVPQYSQEIHSGQYPQWDGGGEAWCSPTSTSMLVAYWGAGPTPTDYAWVDPSYADPWVDYAARNTFDYRYDGCGNWPFNTAYAGRFGLDGFVTRLRSLTEAEAFITAGIPLALSLAFKKGEITGLDYSTSGHLLVLVGFSATGDPVLNDPFSPDDASVRKTVDRAEFETAWLNSSGGTVYVVHATSQPLPPAPSQPNW
jgi:Peptidase_C39 like family